MGRVGAANSMYCTLCLYYSQSKYTDTPQNFLAIIPQSCWRSSFDRAAVNVILSRYLFVDSCWFMDIRGSYDVVRYGRLYLLLS